MSEIMINKCQEKGERNSVVSWAVAVEQNGGSSKINCCNEVLEGNLSSSSSSSSSNLKTNNPCNLKSFSFWKSRCRGTKNHLANSSCWQEPCTVGPVEPTPTGIEEKVIKSTFRFSLFASGFREKAWRRREAFWTFPLGHKGGESKTECSAKICSLYKSWKYYMHIHTMFSNLIKFGINMDIASNKKIPYHCSLALCLWWNTNISRLVHLQYYDPNRESLNWVYKPYYWVI